MDTLIPKPDSIKKKANQSRLRRRCRRAAGRLLTFTLKENLYGAEELRRYWEEASVRSCI